MTSPSDYNSDEWAKLVRAPLLAGLSLTLADPGGPIEAVKESLATMKNVASLQSEAELVIAVSQELLAAAQQRTNPLADFDLDTSRAEEHILEEMRTVSLILDAKATPAEAADFRAWLLDAARSAAEASKEGGFLGIGAVRVSEAEHQMLARLVDVLGTPVPARRSEKMTSAGVPKVDPDLCSGCGICEDICPEVFHVGDDGLCHVADIQACEEVDCCEEAVDECPEGAISIEPPADDD